MLFFLRHMILKRGGAPHRLPPMCKTSTSAGTSSAGDGQNEKNDEKGVRTMPVHKEYWSPPPNMVNAAWYRRKKQRDPFNILQEETLTEADKSVEGWRLHDYYKIQELVNMLPTVKEKIDFVNPYEREWGQQERKWHRRWLQPLLRPRTAWHLPPTPNYFASLDFCKYVTKTRLADADEAEQHFDAYYKNLTLPTTKFENLITETLIAELERDELAKLENHPEEERAENRAKFLRSLIEDAHFALAHGHSSLLDHRISHTSRCESFWIRAGFLSLYDKLPVWETDEQNKKSQKIRLTGDDRRRLGELAFTMRDNHVVQVRTRKPMKKLFDWHDKTKLEAPLFSPDFDVNEEVIFSPKMYNLMPDRDPLWQCPGYEYDSNETHKYGRLAVKDITPLINRISDVWRCDSELEKNEMLEECLAATAITSLFSWLNSQAHCLGHTQYTEIQEPLSSQLMLSDGHQLFYFALGQLNTIAINIDVQGFENRRTNVCCVEGPLKLYDEFNKNKGTFRHYDYKRSKLRDGLNPHVLERILQMCIVH